MKTRAVLWALLTVMLVAFAAIVSRKAIADGENEIPPPVGKFSSTLQGSVAICLDPSTLQGESCTTSGVLVVPLTFLGNGAESLDSQGDACGTFTETDSNLPVDASPPLVRQNEHVSGKTLNYDSTTGTGDGSFTVYTGGTCNGAIFDSTGATELASGTDHFVVTDGGKRFDFLFTKLTNPANSAGDFSVSGTDLKQTNSNS
jgi:hypothetical protein